jgi:hypothetical protein
MVAVDLFRFMQSFQKTAVGDTLVVPANVLDRYVLDGTMVTWCECQALYIFYFAKKGLLVAILPKDVKRKDWASSFAVLTIKLAS